MNPTSFRGLAAKLGVAASTVSRAFHGDPRISRATRERVMALIRKEGYQLDPTVSVGMSKIRQQQFYRETIAWCADKPRDHLPWFESLYASAEDFGTRLGYKIEFFHYGRGDPHAYTRLSRSWKSRGIQGVILGPLQVRPKNLNFAWDDFAWVMIGRPFEQPALHSVGRDFGSDIETALRWLSARGCRRVVFLLNSRDHYSLQRDTLRESLAHYEEARNRPRRPYFDLGTEKPERLASWLQTSRPDGLILPSLQRGQVEAILRPLLKTLPTVFLSGYRVGVEPGQAWFNPRFEVMGHSSVNLLHRLLSNREFGIPTYRQRIIVDSPFSELPAPCP